MKKFSIFLLIIISGQLLSAQNAAKAQALLDEVYTKVTTYENMVVDFKYELKSTEADINSETRGKVTLSGDKYLGELFGTQQMFDGHKVYTIIPENEEVTVEDKSEEEDAFTPSKMFTFYKKGHTYAWDILQNVQGRKIQYVKLVPIDSDTEIKHILMGIDVGTKHIYKIIETGKNGATTTVTVNSFKTDQPLSKTLFTFDETKYETEGYYIIRN